jgi:Succinate dehydrogenase/Fumarate reductase transmembrane subunit
VIWLSAAAAGPEFDAVVQRAIVSWAGRVVLFGVTFAFFLHLCGGIRHLVWDTVHGFELRSIYISGWSVVAASAMLTVAAWAAAGYRRSFRSPHSPLGRAIGPGSAKRGAALDGGTGDGGRARAADAVVRGIDHCPL